MHTRGGVVDHAAAVFAEVIVVPTAFYCALFHFEMFPRDGAFAQGNGRLKALLCTLKCAIGALQALRFVSGQWYAASLMAAYAVVALQYWLFLPYYRWWLNSMHVSLLAASAFGSAQSLSDLLEEAKKRFPDSYTVWLICGVAHLELNNNLHGMSANAREAKRMDHWIDIDFVINSFLQRCSDDTRSTGNRDKAISAALEVSDRHERSARLFAARFWQRLLMARGDVADTGFLMHLADSFGDSERAAFNCEEDAARKTTKRAKGVKVAMAPFTPMACELEDIEDGCEAAQSEVGQSSVPGAERSTGGSSIKSSASAINDDVAHLRAVRNRIESIRYGTARKLHMAVVVSLLLVATCLTLEYTVSQQRANTFGDDVRMIDTSVGLRRGLFSAIAEVRELEMAIRSGNSTRQGVLSRIDAVRATSLDFERRFSQAFINSDLMPEISSFWANSRVPVRLFINGENSSLFSEGRYVGQQLPLWDAGNSLLNSVRDLCSLIAKDPSGSKWRAGDGLRANAHFRFALDNGPTAIAAAIGQSYVPFAAGVQEAAESISFISLVLFPVSIGLGVASFAAIYAIILRRVSAEREAALSLFLPNFKLKLAVSLLVLSGLCAAMFGVVYTFSKGHMHDGTLFRGIGVRRNDIVVIAFLSQELAVDDNTTGLLADKRAYLKSNIIPGLLTLDRQLKYGDRKAGFIPYLSKDSGMKELWFIDTAIRFVNLPASMTTLDSPDLEDLHEIQGVLSTWLTDGLDTLTAQGDIMRSEMLAKLMAVYWISIVVCLVAYWLLRTTINKLQSEVERLVQMLLFLPINVLDTVSNIHDFLEANTELAYSKTSAKVTYQIALSLLN
eukprot:m51a1_g12704 hypothetical protein (844) ;mRNA; r:81-3677